MMIKIQKKEFSIEEEIESIKEKHSDVGAVNTFIGTNPKVILFNLKRNKFNLHIYLFFGSKKLIMG